MVDDQTKSDREIAGEIVSAYLSNNQMPADEVPNFIRGVVSALGGGQDGDQPVPLAAERGKPAVPIKRSVRDDAVVCLECGAEQRTLKRHIGTAHGMSEADYRSRWNLPKDHPLVAPSYSRTRSSMAKKIGLGQQGRKKRSGRSGRAKK